MKRVILGFILFVGCTSIQHQERTVQSVTDKNNQINPQSLKTRSNEFNTILDEEIKIEDVKSPEHLSRLYYHEPTENPSSYDLKDKTLKQNSIKKSKKAILILHGLHESPYYMQSISEFFYGRGYNVVSYLLPGHQSKNINRISNVKYSDWISGVAQAFEVTKSLGDEIEVLGYSTGGTLAYYLTLVHPDLVKKMYLISPALALNEKVFISSVALNPLKINSHNLCRKKENRILCRFLKTSDDQVEPMMSEGLVISANAGFEVQNLINFLLKTFGSNNTNGFSADTLKTQNRTDFFSESNGDYYKDLMGVYLQAHVPLVMINTENDNVVLTNFNNNLARQYKGQKVNLLFEKDSGVTHISITKSDKERFKKNPEVFNNRFNEILEAFAKTPQ